MAIPDITKSKKQWDGEIRTSARDFYLSNMSLSEISEELGVPIPTLRYWQNKDRWAE